MLTIRLSRVGKKKHPNFRVIISEKPRDTFGNYLELLGYYNPHTNKAELKTDRIKYWLAKGAQTSGTVHNLLIDHQIISGEKIKVANIKKKREEKAEKKEEKAAIKREKSEAAEKKTGEPKKADKKPEEKPDQAKEDKK